MRGFSRILDAQIWIGVRRGEIFVASAGIAQIIRLADTPPSATFMVLVRVDSSSLHDRHKRPIFHGGRGVSSITFRVKVRSTSSSRVRACASVPTLFMPQE
jgi:hypothetical protein